MSISCCKGCVAPKRHEACWGHCPEYLEQKAEHDRIKAEHDKQERLTGAIIGGQIDKIYKVMKNRRTKKI